MRLLLLPGMDGTGRLFEPLLHALPPSLPAHVVAYPPDRAIGYGELLPLVEAAATGGGEFVVLGESFSGPLALMLAARLPAGLRGVVLCASFVRFPMPALPERLRTMVRPWMFRLQPMRLVAWALLGRHRRGDLGRLLGESLRSVSPAAMAARARAVAEVDVTEQLRSCPVPVLYLQAAEDRVIRPRCWELVRAVRRDAEVAELQGPHLVLQVAPTEAVRVLAAFCERVGTPNQARQLTGGA